MVMDMDYIWGRLFNFDSTKPLASWIKSSFEPIKDIPRYWYPAILMQCSVAYTICGTSCPRNDA
ncbi:hypothetical protein DOY81_009260 [Sarcophaga bullata]|nr:hypothetical protein DOY81_009260 [Sarcophaga bullata]